MPEDSRDAGNGEGCRELYVMPVRGGNGAVVSNNGLTKGGSSEERGWAVVGLQNLPKNNKIKGKGRGYLECS